MNEREWSEDSLFHGVLFQGGREGGCALESLLPLTASPALVTLTDFGVAYGRKCAVQDMVEFTKRRGEIRASIGSPLWAEGNEGSER